MKKKLLIIIPDRLSILIQKGEVVSRYYNPGDLFEEVHIMMTNDDKPDPKTVQPMVGKAKLFLHNYPEPPNFFKRTLGWQPFLMRKWVEYALQLVSQINPHLIRCHGLYLNTFIAVKLKLALKIPVIVSLHGNPDVDYLRGRLAKNLKDKILGKCQEYLETYCLKYIDHVIAVYSPIVSYLDKHKVKSYSIIHNVVGWGASKKDNYDLDDKKVHLICVGRQEHFQKDPSNIIRAVSNLSNVYLTMIGTGSLHYHLVGLANELNCSDRILFIKNLHNREVLKLMKNSDIYIYHSINYEISKSTMEASLVGLPIILNDRNGQPAQELLDANFYLVKDSERGYLEAIKNLISDFSVRKNLANHSHEYALTHWSPMIIENKIVELYQRYLIK